MKLANKQNFSPLLLIFTLGTIFIFIKLVSPLGMKLTEQSTKLSQKKSQLKDYKRLIRHEDQLKEKLSILSQQIQQEIPDQREKSEFLAKIDEVAENTNVFISTMNPLPYKEFDSFNELSVEIEMDANLGNLTRFLYEMRKSSVLLVADKLTLEPKSDVSALLNGKLVISTIFPKE